MAMKTELVESRRELPSGGRLVRPADPKELIHITVYLRRRTLESALTALPPFGPGHPSERQYVAREGFAAVYGALPEDATAVQTAAARSDVQVIEVNLARRAVRLSGTVDQMNRLFGTELGIYEGPLGQFRARVGTLQVPEGLEDRIVGVFGLDQRPQVRTHFRIAQVAEISYTPQEVATAYEFPAGTSGAGQCIGLLEFGGGFRTEDLKSFFASAGLPLPTVTAVSVDGVGNAPTGDANGPDGEVELDIEMAGALAPGARIAAYFAPNSDQGFLDALTTAIHDSVNRPNLLSISWGGPEASWTAQAMTEFNAACEDATALGITVIAAAGDGGASDGGPAGTLAVDFPASAPYVLGCGGTRLLLDVEDADEITEEVVWNDLSENEGATGGGVSQFFPLPTFQRSAGVPLGDGGFAGRGVPDVAGDADPGTGYSMFVDGAPLVIGGTSAVAPLWAGLIARLNQSLGATVGYLQPLVYVGPESGTFHEITEGNNGGFDAGPGWNACTGLGSPNGAALLAALARKS
ncbi:MAG: S53 family peptidase [Thermoplasmata archaeon]